MFSTCSLLETISFVLLLVPPSSLVSGWTATWSSLSAGLSGPSPPGRVPAGYSHCDGTLYIFGGETDSGDGSTGMPNVYLNDLWSYTLGSSSWKDLSPSSSSPLPPPRACAAMVCDPASKTLTLFGGLTRPSPTDPSTVPLGDVWVFDLISRTWEDVTPKRRGGSTSPLPLSSFSATLLNSTHAVIFGGSKEDFALSDETWLWSIKEREFERVQTSKSVPQARDFHTAAAEKHKNMNSLVMFGGVDDGLLWRFDLSKGSWSSEPSDLAYQSGRAAFLTNQGNEEVLCTFGGMLFKDGSPEYMNEVEVISDDGSWLVAKEDGNDAPKGRCYAAIVDDVGAGALVYGGYQRTGEKGEMERLNDLWLLKIQE